LKSDLAKTIYGVASKQHINMSEFTEMLNMMTSIMCLIVSCWLFWTEWIEYKKLRRQTELLIPIIYAHEVQEVSQQQANPVIDELIAEEPPEFEELPAEDEVQPQRRQRRRLRRGKVRYTSVKNTKKYARENNLVGENCPICLEEFKSQCTMHKTRCNHHFHPKCLKQLKEQYQNRVRIKCPICRTNL
jgi:ABC-type nickel/cobalt efflux system permease component RcnA